MKVKKLYPLLIVAAFAASVINSCSPTVTAEPPVTLVKIKTGGQMTLTSSNLYDYALSCGCAFPLAIDAYDTISLSYDVTHLKDTISDHKIPVTAKSGLSKGMHTGFLAITTIQPITTELLKDTLRDTVIVP